MTAQGKTYKLEDLGFNDFFASSRHQLGLDGFLVARVIAEHKQAYNVIHENGLSLARITGKHMFSTASREGFPAVGDWVAILEQEPGKGTIQAILPRKTVIKRNTGDRNKSGGKTETQVIGANIDIAFVAESIGRDYNLNRLERYFVLAKNGGVEPAIVLNKTDLISEEDLKAKLAEIQTRFPGIDVISTSTVSDSGLDALKKYIVPGKTYCFLGSSGVGKSSLINKLLGEDVVKTGKISFTSGRGRHVTTSRQMYFLANGAIVIDNPGMREVGMAESSEGIDAFFEQITALAPACKFADCSHTHEPGCAVIRAVREGTLDEEKYSNYLNLKKEAGFYRMNSLEKRQKDRQFGKFIKKAKKDLKSLGRKY